MAAVLNLVRDEDGIQVYPRVRVTYTNLRTLGDASTVADPRVGGPGEINRRTFRRGRPVTYSGFVEARSLEDFETYSGELLEAFADISAEGRMDAAWHPLIGWEPAVFYEAQALGLEIGEPTVSLKVFTASFVLALRNHDGRYFAPGDTATATVDSTNIEEPFA